MEILISFLPWIIFWVLKSHTEESIAFSATIWHYHSDTISIALIVLAIVFTKIYPKYYNKKAII
ncbi:MAG TPA: hypothetical protein DD381_11870 [Lentisphaeria bacterium]|nr:MAG: hypothetical protein A2X47_02565 [Lentisphaerae bacterium GWF2_38_69]HBM17023.1 hypothetical protein [Lentisphaeria bacterium]